MKGSGFLDYTKKKLQDRKDRKLEKLKSQIELKKKICEQNYDKIDTLNGTHLNKLNLSVTKKNALRIFKNRLGIYNRLKVKHDEACFRVAVKDNKLYDENDKEYKLETDTDGQLILLGDTIFMLFLRYIFQWKNWCPNDMKCGGKDGDDGEGDKKYYINGWGKIIASANKNTLNIKMEFEDIKKLATDLKTLIDMGKGGVQNLTDEEKTQLYKKTSNTVQNFLKPLFSAESADDEVNPLMKVSEYIFRRLLLTSENFSSLTDFLPVEEEGKVEVSGGRSIWKNIARSIAPIVLIFLFIWGVASVVTTVASALVEDVDAIPGPSLSVFGSDSDDDMPADDMPADDMPVDEEEYASPLSLGESGDREIPLGDELAIEGSAQYKLIDRVVDAGEGAYYEHKEQTVPPSTADVLKTHIQGQGYTSLIENLSGDEKEVKKKPDNFTTAGPARDPFEGDDKY
jgi:hypothetical protein